jgi:hypothetical protein
MPVVQTAGGVVAHPKLVASTLDVVVVPITRPEMAPVSGPGGETIGDVA